MTEAIVGIIQGKSVGIKGTWSDTVATLVSSRTTPSTPTSLTATSGVDRIVVEWTAPTTDTDGETLIKGAIAGYWVYRKDGGAPTTSVYDARVWVDAEEYHYPITALDDTNTYHFGATAVIGDGTESALSGTDSALVTLKHKGGTNAGATPSEGTGLYLAADYCGYYLDGTGWLNYFKSDGDVYFGGAAGQLQWDYSETTLIVEGTYKTSSSGVRIEIWGYGADAGKFYVKDASDYIRIELEDDDITLKDDSDVVIAYIPTTTGATRATNPYFVHNQVNIDGKLIVGTTGQDNPSQALYVSGTSQFTGAADFDGAITVTDHGTATDPEVVAVVYGTGSPPAANTTPIGTLFVKYSA